MLRLKVSFENYTKKMQSNHMNRIAITINLNQIMTIKDLKTLINKEIVLYGHVENLLLKDDYLLLDSSNPKDILKNDDEIVATLSLQKNKKISFISYKENEVQRRDDNNNESNNYSSSESKMNDVIKHAENKAKTIYQLKPTQFLKRKTERPKSVSLPSNEKTEKEYVKHNNNDRNNTTQSNKTNTTSKKTPNLSLIKPFDENFKPKQLKSNSKPAITNNDHNQLKNNNIPITIDSKDIDINKFILIPCDQLDDINFLQSTYPELFQKDTVIKIKIHELLPNGPGVGDYKIGLIVQYSFDCKSFLIHLIQVPGLPNSLSSMYDYDLEVNIISVQLKNFVEIWIYKPDMIKSNPIANIIPLSDTKDLLVLPFIRRQVQYYFSDKNYFKDSFLQQKAANDPDQFIDIDVIMSFNKIKLMTNNKLLFIEAVKDLECIELNSEQNKIRKRQK